MLNNVGKITAANARLALRISAEESTDKIVEIADVNSDNKITAAYAKMIVSTQDKI